MNPIIFIVGGVIAVGVEAVINKINQKDDDQLNLTIDGESTINENTLIENEETKPHENEQNSPDNNDCGDGAGGGNSVRIEETQTDNLIEDEDNAKQITTDDSGNDGSNSSGTNESTTNT